MTELPSGGFSEQVLPKDGIKASRINESQCNPTVRNPSPGQYPALADNGGKKSAAFVPPICFEAGKHRILCDNQF